MKSTKKLTEKVKSVFSKNGKKTAIDGGEPTFHTSKTYGGTIPYLPGKFKEEYSKEHDEIQENNLNKKQNNKSQNKEKTTKKNNQSK